MHLGLGLSLAAARPAGGSPPPPPAPNPLDGLPSGSDAAWIYPADGDGTATTYSLTDLTDGGHDAVQDDLGESPTLYADGLQFGGTKFLVVTDPPAYAGDFTLGFGGEYAAGNQVWFGNGALPSGGLVLSGQHYLIDDSDTYFSGAAPAPGPVAVVYRRTGGTASIRVNGTDVTTGAMTGTLTIGQLGDRTYSSHHDSGGANRQRRAAVYPAYLTGTDLTDLETWLAVPDGVTVPPPPPPPPPPPGTVFSDDFNRLNTPDGGVGNGWTDAASSWRINGNKLRDANGGLFSNQLYRDLTGLVTPPSSLVSGEDYLFSALVRSNGTVSPMLIRGRADLSSLLYLWGASHSGAFSFSWQGTAPTAGGLSVAPSYTSPACEANGQDYYLRLYCCGDQIAISAADPADPSIPYIAGGIDARAGRLNDGSDLGVAGTDPDYAASFYGPVVGFSGFVPGYVDDVEITKQTPHTLVFCWGDSITAYGWPLTLQACLGLGYRTVNIGISGRSLAQMSTTDAAAVAAQMAAAVAAGKTVWTVVSGGSNDLAGGLTPAAAYASLQSCVSVARTAGASKVWAWGPVLPRTAGFSGGVDAAAFAAARTTYGGLVTAGATTAAAGYAAIDPAAFDAGLLDPTDGDYYGDQVHPMPFGMYGVGRAHSPVVSAATA